MFTGIIEAVGELAELKPIPTGFRLRILTALAPEIQEGQSLAVNGVCLTVIASTGDEVNVDVSPATARVSTFGSLKRGVQVNIERAVRADGRLDGHLVQGHVDGTGTVEDLREEGDFRWLTVRFADDMAAYIVRKGSIAVNGISLTVAGVDERHFDCQIVPYTWDHTNLRTTRVGDSVNLECDIIGKYVVRVAELAGFGAARRKQSSV